MKLESTKGTYTLTSICIFTFVQCMFLWLFHRPEYSSSAPRAPSPLPRLWSYLNTATLPCNPHYILYVDSYIITALTLLTCLLQTWIFIITRFIYAIILVFILWENKLNVSGISFIHFVLCLRVFAFQKTHQGSSILNPHRRQNWDHESIRRQVPVDSVQYQRIPRGVFKIVLLLMR